MNRIQPKLLRRLRTTIDDAMNAAGLPLIGVVPEDDALSVSLNRGVPLLLADRGMSSAAAAYRNIAKRVAGGKAPLLRIR